MQLLLLIASLFTFVEFNCENLFDCEHDSLKNDYEFLPASQRHWDSHKYWQKVNNVARAVLSCGEQDGTEWALPDMVALCEVENDSVIRDLARRSLLRKAGYEYIVTQSGDERGIDVALLYSPFSFRLISHTALRIPPEGRQHPTRDVLYACGVVRGGDTLHVLAVHAPSRASGAAQTNAYRVRVAQRVAEAVDSIRAAQQHPLIIVAGDFNDYQGDEAIRLLQEHGLTDVSAAAVGQNGARGTYKYRGRWGSLDHIFVNSLLLHNLSTCRVHDADFLIEEDERYGGVQPCRTFIGRRYHGGTSDHLPLVASFML